MKQKNHKPKLPKRLCRDSQTQYCKGEFRHRGCCECWEFNHGDPHFTKCQPIHLKEYWIENGWLDEAAEFFPSV